MHALYRSFDPADRRSATRGAFAVMFMCMMCVCMTVRRERGEECWTPLNPRRDATPCTQATMLGLRCSEAIGRSQSSQTEFRSTTRWRNGGGSWRIGGSLVL